MVSPTISASAACHLRSGPQRRKCLSFSPGVGRAGSVVFFRVFEVFFQAFAADHQSAEEAGFVEGDDGLLPERVAFSKMGPVKGMSRPYSLASAQRASLMPGWSLLK
jgi:hypothetical protein